MKLQATILFLLAVLLFASPVYSRTVNNIMIGSKAPYFELSGYTKDARNKSTWNINEFNGSWLILYFYPKDFTEGCTIEARGFENMVKNFKSKNARVVGISNDSMNSHALFCGTEELSLLLLTDQNGKISKAYDAWNDPYSKRNTLLIDPKGFVRYKWNNVNPSRHPAEVLDVLTNILEN